MIDDEGRYWSSSETNELSAVASPSFRERGRPDLRCIADGFPNPTTPGVSHTGDPPVSGGVEEQHLLVLAKDPLVEIDATPLALAGEPLGPKAVEVALKELAIDLVADLGREQRQLALRAKVLTMGG